MCQFAVGHRFGGSHGESRVYRLADPDPLYAELAAAAGDLWRRLEAESDARILVSCGMLSFGMPRSARLEAIVRNLTTLHIPHEILDPDGLEARFPLMAVAEDRRACWVPSAGLIDTSTTLEANIRVGLSRSGRIVEGVEVVRIDLSGRNPRLVTRGRQYECERLVVAVGTWTAAIVPELKPFLSITRQQVFYFRPTDRRNYGPESLPVYGDADAHFYGFPEYRGLIKAAGSRLPDVASSPRMAERDRLASLLSELLPAASLEYAGMDTCLYGLTPTRDFVVGFRGRTCVRCDEGSSRCGVRHPEGVGSV